MCIGFFKKLLGLDDVDENDTEMHEYQETGKEIEDEGIQSAESEEESSSEEYEFDEEGIYEEPGQEVNSYSQGPGNEIQTIENEGEEVQGASSTDDEAEDVVTPGHTKDGEISILGSMDTTVGSFTTQVQEVQMKAAPVQKTPLKNVKKNAKSKKKPNAFHAKAHERFKSKGKKMMNKRKLKMKKKPVQKTEVK